MALKSKWVILLVLVAGYFLIFSTLSILKHRAFHSTYLDLGLEAQSVWNTGQGRFLTVSFGERGEEISAFSYHVSPIVALLAPFYRLWPSVELLLVIQTFVLALGAAPLYLLAEALLKSRWLAHAVVISYFLNPSLQWSNLTDFHPQTLATTPLLFLFWFYHQKKWFWFFFLFLVSLSIKENISLITATFGLFIFFKWYFKWYQNKRRASRSSLPNLNFLPNGWEGVVGLAVLIISLVWFFGAVYLVMPGFSGGQMGALGRYEYLGKTPGAIILRLMTDPLGDLRILLVTAKIKYLFHLLVSAGFLSLLAPQYLLLAGSDLFLNLFSAYNPQWQVKFHYTAAITPFVYIAAIFGLVRFRQMAKKWLPTSEPFLWRLAPFYLILISVFWNYVHSPSPLNRDFDPSLYQITDADKKYERVLQSIPLEASVSAMNNLAAHLANRRFLWRFPIGMGRADYLVVDPTLPGKNFDLAQINKDDFEALWNGAVADPHYETYYQSKNLFILKRNSLLD